jgi:fatty acid desaturase
LWVLYNRVSFKSPQQLVGFAVTLVEIFRKFRSGVANPRPKKKFLGPNLELKLADFECFSTVILYIILLYYIIFLEIFPIAVWVGYPWFRLTVFFYSFLRLFEYFKIRVS